MAKVFIEKQLINIYIASNSNIISLNTAFIAPLNTYWYYARVLQLQFE